MESMHKPDIGEGVKGADMKEVVCEEVYNEYYDSAGNYHWTGTLSGEHIVRVEE